MTPNSVNTSSGDSSRATDLAGQTPHMLTPGDSWGDSSRGDSWGDSWELTTGPLGQQTIGPPRWGHNWGHSREPPTSWAELRACNATELECWRNKQGWPLGDQELTGDTNPFELGLSNWVELNKGCYLGQETVAKLASRGGVKQQLRCWQSTSEIQEVLKSGDQLKLNDSRAGMITSVSKNTATGRGFGLALVRRQALDAETLQVEDSDVEVSIARPSAFYDPPSRS